MHMIHEVREGRCAKGRCTHPGSARKKRRWLLLPSRTVALARLQHQPMQQQTIILVLSRNSTPHDCQHTGVGRWQDFHKTTRSQAAWLPPRTFRPTPACVHAAALPAAHPPALRTLHTRFNLPPTAPTLGVCTPSDAMRTHLLMHSIHDAAHIHVVPDLLRFRLIVRNRRPP
eukprot:363781-Chlamydomonas_euryale.AAC.18